MHWEAFARSDYCFITLSTSVTLGTRLKHCLGDSIVKIFV